MRATLIFPPAYLPWRLVAGTNPLGVHILGTLLNKNGIETTVLDQYAFSDLLRGPKKFEVGSFLDHAGFRSAVARADIMGLSCDSFNYSVGLLMIRAAREINKHIKICIGGVHATLLDEVVAKYSGADLVVRGEAESRIVEIMSTLVANPGYPRIPGISYVDDTGRVTRTEEAAFVCAEVLAALNEIDYEHLSSLSQLASLSVETSRGCLYRCRFCSVPYKGKRRLLPIENCKRAFESALRHRKSIVLTDDCLTSEPARAGEILSFLNRHNCSVTFEARASDIDRSGGQVLESISGTKVHHMQIGVECGYEEGLKKIRKGITLDQVRNACRIAKERGVQVMLTFIIGFPWEGKDECLATISFAESLRHEFGVQAFINWWIPSPSEVWEENRARFNIDERMYEDPRWPISEEVFHATHPEIGPSMRKKVEYVMREATNI